MILGERIQLRAIAEADLPLLVQWRKDSEVSQHFFHQEPLSLAKQKRWFASFLKKDNELYWIAEHRETNDPLGTVAFTNIDSHNHKAELGRILIFPKEYHRQGYSRKMCKLALKYAFSELNLNRISLLVFANNESAIGLYRQLGFHEEGRLREYTFTQGEYRDALMFSLLRHEFTTE